MEFDKCAGCEFSYTYNDGVLWCDDCCSPVSEMDKDIVRSCALNLLGKSVYDDEEEFSE